ncbi:MAG: DUF2080 family transposase-associated protein [Nanoarchaeota archaeon]
MNTQQLAVREQIVKTVVKSGNGGAVWVPKDWLGEQVFVILPEKPKLSVKEKIMAAIGPYLKDITAVAVYGSYARNEQERGSDIDVLVITRGQKTGLKFKEGNLDIVFLPLDKLKTAIEKYPTLYYQSVQEAVPLINASVLEELKDVKISKESFKPYLRETEEHLKSSRELLELDKIDGQYVKSYSVLYSAMLRLRALFIVKFILENEKFSNKKFKGFLLGKGLDIKELSASYKAYRLVRDEMSLGSLRIKIAVAEKVLNILEKELKALEAKVYGK